MLILSGLGGNSNGGGAPLMLVMIIIRLSVIPYIIGILTISIPDLSPTYINFGKIPKGCDIIFSIEGLTWLPILLNQV